MFSVACVRDCRRAVPPALLLTGALEAFERLEVTADYVMSLIQQAYQRVSMQIHPTSLTYHNIPQTSFGILAVCSRQHAAVDP